MRIISGSAAGQILKVPKGFAVRPTADLVRQAIFNSLGDRVVGTHVLELFGGTGALSLECLSRGAIAALCIELSSKHARVIRENLRQVGLPTAAFQVRVQDVFTSLPQLAAANRQFDLIIADPPYGEKNLGRRSVSFAQRLLDDPNVKDVLIDSGLFVLGYARRDTLDIPPRWKQTKLLKHGDSMVIFLEKKIPCP